MAAVLLVVNDTGALSTGDTKLKADLEALGHTVTTRNQADSEVTSGYDACVLSSSWLVASTYGKYNGDNFPTLAIGAPGSSYAAAHIGLSFANDKSLGSYTQDCYIDGTDIDVSADWGAAAAGFGNVETTSSSGGVIGYVDDAATTGVINTLGHRSSPATRFSCRTGTPGDTLNTSYGAPSTAAHRVAWLGWASRLEAGTISVNGDVFLSALLEWVVPVGGPDTVERTGSVAGTGTLAAAGYVVRPRTGSTSGTGALAGSGVRLVERTGSTTGDSTLEAAGGILGSIPIDRTGSLTGTAELTGEGLRILLGTGSTSGESILAAAGIRVVDRTATAAGIASLAAAGESLIVIERTGTISAVGTLAAGGLRIAVRFGSMAGLGELGAVGALTANRTASITGSGLLTASGGLPIEPLDFLFTAEPSGLLITAQSTPLVVSPEMIEPINTQEPSLALVSGRN